MTLASLLSLLLIAPTAAFAPSKLGALVTTTNNNVDAPSRLSSSLQALVAPSSSSPSSTLEAILFDCDGVLADTERDGHRLAFNIAFENNGIDEEWSEERYGKLLEVGGGKERMTAHWNEVGWPAQIPNDTSRTSKVMSLHLQKTDIFGTLVDDGKIPLRSGILRLVDEAIASGVRLAVCSTSNEKAVSNLVSTLMGPRRAAQFRIFAGDVVKAKKPAPDVYLMAVEEMGLDGSRCVIVEDSRIGVGAAVAAGIPCLVTKSGYTAEEDFAGAKMIVEELGDDAEDCITLETLACLLDGNSDREECVISSWDPVGHIETTGASWTGARMGDANVNKGREYTASETYAAISETRGLGVKMEAHVERGGASWTGARFGQNSEPTAPSKTYQALGQRGIGVDVENHIEKGGASWTGARFGQNSEPTAPSKTSQALGKRGIGVNMEAHVERGGASWTGARFGQNSEPTAPSKTYQALGQRGIGVNVENHIEKGGASWTGARFGQNSEPSRPLKTNQALRQRGIGVEVENHIEKGGASWTGARFGQNSEPTAPSRTHQALGQRGLGVDIENHIEKGGASWTGARFGQNSEPTAPSRTHQALGQRGIGVDVENHIEKGGASWTGARFGEDNPNAAHPYTPSETYQFKSQTKSSGIEWDSVAHTEVATEGRDIVDGYWSGARFGDENRKRCAPTPSRWHE